VIFTLNHFAVKNFGYVKKSKNFIVTGFFDNFKQQTTVFCKKEIKFVQFCKENIQKLLFLSIKIIFYKTQ